MARVKTHELSAIMNTLNEKLRGKLSDHIKTPNHHASTSINSNYDIIYGLVNREDVLKLAACLAVINDNKTGRTALQSAIFKGGGATNFSECISDITGALNQSNTKVTTKTVSIAAQRIEDVGKIEEIIKDIKTKAGDAIKKSDPLACKLFDTFLAVALQSVPFVGNALSSVSKIGIAGAILDAGVTMAKTSAGTAIDQNRHADAIANKDNLSVGFQGYTAGQRLVGEVREGVNVGNDIQWQLAGNAARAGIDLAEAVVREGASEVFEEGGTIRTALTTPLNTAALYKFISARTEKKLGVAVAAAVNDEEFFKKILLNGQYNTFMQTQDNTGQFKRDLFNFQTRGIDRSKLDIAAIPVVDAFQETFIVKSGATIEKCLGAFSKKMIAYRNFVTVCIDSNFVSAMSGSISACKVEARNIGKFDLLNNDINAAAFIIMAAYLYKKVQSDTNLQQFLIKKRTEDNAVDNAILSSLHLSNQSQNSPLRISRLNSTETDDQLSARRKSFVDLKNTLNNAKGTGNQDIDINNIINEITIRETKIASLLGRRAEIELENKRESKRSTLDNAAYRAMKPNFLAQPSGDDSGNTISWHELSSKSVGFIHDAKEAVLNEISLTFPQMAAAQVSEALSTLVAANIIISNVHSAIAANATIHIDPGAAILLSEIKMSSTALRAGEKPIRGFVKLYSKTFGIISDSKKDNLVKSNVYANAKVKNEANATGAKGELELHSLRFPKGTGIKGVGGASVREVTRLYMFACTVIAYADIGSIVLGLAKWEDIRQFLNQAIKEINELTANISDEDLKEISSKEREIKNYNKENNAEDSIKKSEEKAKQAKLDIIKLKKANNESLTLREGWRDTRSKIKGLFGGKK